MNQILERRAENGETEESVRNSQLAVLKELHGMSLSTQDIIASKIGVAVSKLRKSGYVLVDAICLASEWITDGSFLSAVETTR